MATRDTILTTALHLFNAHGTDAITVRHIAREMGISHGNLCYHFPRTDDIIQQLYLNLVAELSAEVQALQQQPPSLEQLLQGLQRSFATQARYRFLLLDFVRIMRRIPAVQTHFRALFAHRRQQFAAIIGYLIKAGDFQPEQYPGQHDHFTAQFYLLGDFWLAEAEILFDGSDDDKLTHYTRVAAGLIFLYLTEQGRRQLRPWLTATP